LTRHHVTFHAVTSAGDGPATTPVADQPSGDAGPVTVHADVAVPWDTPATLNWWGDTVSFAPGSVRPAGDPARVKLLLDHDTSQPFGYGVAFASTPAGLDATFAVPRDEMTNPPVGHAVRQMGNGVRDALSIGVDFLEVEETVVDSRTDTWHVNVLDAELLEVSSVVLPRFSDARHDPVAASADPATLRWSAMRAQVRTVHAADTPTDPEPEPDDDTDDDTDDDDTDTLEDDPMAATDTTTPDDLAARRAAVTANRAGGATAARAHGRYPTFGDFVIANAAGLVPVDYRNMVFANLVDELTTDVPGLVPDAWISDVVDLLKAVTPTLQAFSRKPLPASGMNVNIPHVVQDPDVGVQAAQKGDIATRKALINPVTLPVKTYAGGQDISIQTVERTEPAYLNILMGLFVKEMGINVNKDANAALVAGTTATGAVVAANLNGSFVDAAAAILTAVWQLPDVAVLGVNAWKQLGKATDSTARPLFPGLSPVNPVGSFSVADAQGNVRGLSYFVDVSMDPTMAIVGVSDAFVSLQGPMGTLTADVPQKLGHDVAVYEFCAFGVVDARGLYKLTGFTGTGTPQVPSILDAGPEADDDDEAPPAKRGK
jgi:HK97 family phage major capsid protein